MGGSCEHTFTPDRSYVGDDSYEHKGGDNSDDNRWQLTEDTPGVRDGTWFCPHDAVDGHEKCIYHLPVEQRPEGRSATDSFLRTVRSIDESDDRHRRRRKLQFVDAVFDEFDLRGEVVGGNVNYFIDLSYAEIRNAEFTDARFTQPIRLTRAHFPDPTWFRQSEFEQFASFRFARFESDVRFRGTTFHAPAHFKGATFESDAWFWYSVFRRFVIFRRASFEGVAYFRGADFVNYARFSQVDFHDEVTFKLAEFGDDADFIQTRFLGDHTFYQAAFDRTTDFSDIVVDGAMDLTDASFTTLNITPDSIRGSVQYVDLSDSEISDGELGQPTAGDIVYDLENSTVGSVDFTTPGDGGIIEHIRFVRTAYDGFEFENDALDPQSSDWRLHTVFDESVLPAEKQGTPSAKVLTETYLNAKNGAKQTGNNTAIGKFYYKEMTYRRKHIVAPISNLGSRPLSVSTWLNSLKAGGAWLRHSILALTTGYGERPDRVIGSSIGVVVLFAAAYTRTITPPPTLDEAALFSLQSFITFIYGPVPRDTNRTVAMLSTVEGFVGAFFVALFVYAFTRRLTR